MARAGAEMGRYDRAGMMHAGEWVVIAMVVNEHRARAPIGGDARLTEVCVCHLCWCAVTAVAASRAMWPGRRLGERGGSS